MLRGPLRDSSILVDVVQMENGRPSNTDTPTGKSHDWSETNFAVHAKSGLQRPAEISIKSVTH
jgi:hypothetical protein